MFISSRFIAGFFFNTKFQEIAHAMTLLTNLEEGGS